MNVLKTTVLYIFKLNFNVTYLKNKTENNTFLYTLQD